MDTVVTGNAPNSAVVMFDTFRSSAAAVVSLTKHKESIITEKINGE